MFPPIWSPWRLLLSPLAPSNSSRSRLAPFSFAAFLQARTLSLFRASLPIYSASPVPSYFIPPSNVTWAQPITTWAETMGTRDKPGANQSNPFERAELLELLRPLPRPPPPLFLLYPRRVDQRQVILVNVSRMVRCTRSFSHRVRKQSGNKLFEREGGRVSAAAAILIRN